MGETVSVNGVREKVERIISDNQRLRKELVRLENEKDRLTYKVRESEVKIADLQKKVDAMELGEAMTSMSGDNRKARLRINRLLREIDKCIALMNR